MKRILVTGGLGYIGSHTVVELINSGFAVDIIDDLSNSKIEILDQIEKITNIKPKFHQFNLLNRNLLIDLLGNTKFEAIIHFAAFKSVGESMNKALSYYDNNIGSLINVLQAMNECSCQNLIFSSSCTVYGDTRDLPVTEDTITKNATSVYGTTKLMAEKIIADVAKSDDNNFDVIALRYFNPAGAHESGLIGELPSGIPNNLFPYITQTYAGKREELQIFGGDYDTPDGTAIRDYIHVVDLANAHVAAVKRLIDNRSNVNYEFINIGTGMGFSVLEIVKSFENITQKPLSYKIVGRREGDVEQIWADASMAYDKLNWKAQFGINEIVSSAWKWEKNIKELYD